MAWRIEIDPAAAPDPAKLDQRTARRVLSFLHDRVGTLADPCSGDML